MDLVRSRLHAIDTADHEERLWRRVYPPTDREGLPLVAFVFADTTEAKVANTLAVLGESGRRYWASRRYESYHRGIAALDYGQAVPVVITTLEQLQEHGADAEVWRRLGRKGEQTLRAVLDSPGGDALYRAKAARAIGFSPTVRPSTCTARPAGFNAPSQDGGEGAKCSFWVPSRRRSSQGTRSHRWRAARGSASARSRIRA